jgi:tripartite-type tricarboxylate transporter receptor subunit TctC
MFRVIQLFISVSVALMAFSATGQEFPRQPIRLVQQFAPGGGSDVVARPLGVELSKIMGQAFIVDNKPGANGVIANQYVADSKPDGYTLLFAAAGAMTAAPHLYGLRVDPMSAFIPVALVVKTPYAIIANQSVRVSTLHDLLALAKKDPGTVSYGTSGVGGAPHLAGEMLSVATGARFLPVAYKGMGPAMTAVLSGEVNFAFADIAYTVPQVDSGKIKILAVTGEKRSSALPGVQTVQELGIPGYQSGTWYGIFAPKGTPDAIVRKINAAVNEALAGDLSKRFIAQGMEPAGGMTIQKFAEFVKEDYARNGDLIKKQGIKVEQ